MKGVGEKQAAGTPAGEAPRTKVVAAEGLAEAQGARRISMAEKLEFGSAKCVCPKCGTTVAHARRGIPCSEKLCPKCGTRMRGEQCSRSD